jgi:hypothetical protein
MPTPERSSCVRGRGRAVRAAVTATRRALLALLLACTALVSLHGQTTPSVTVRSAPDFATNVMGDPWDFDQPSDYAHMFSSGWLGMPAVTGGLFRGRVASGQHNHPLLQMLFEGVHGAWNQLERTGVAFPIDTRRYKRLAIRMRRTTAPHVADTLDATWIQNSCRGCANEVGIRVFASSGLDQHSSGKYVNQSPVAEQTSATRFHIYKLDLTGGPNHPAWNNGPAWDASAVVRGLRLRLGEGPYSDGSLNGADIEIDWVRLVPIGETLIDLQWTSNASSVTLTALHAQTGDTVQIFPDDGTSATTFPANGIFRWDYGYLPPGTWTVTARGSNNVVREVARVVIDPAPVVTVVEPDARGGEDFATTRIGDPWDLASPDDVTRFGGYSNLASASFGSTGLTGWTIAGNSDPLVSLLDDSPRPLTAQRHVDADRYRHLTFTLEYDRKDLLAHEALSDAWGGMARVIWRGAHENGGPLTNSNDIFPLDGGPRTYSIDLKSATRFDYPTCADCELDYGGTRLWTGPIALLRIDPYESQVPRWFRLSDVTLAADDEPNALGRFLIRWQTTDATFTAGVPNARGADATVRLEYDTDTNPANGRVLIANGVPATAGQYWWDMSAVSPALAPGGRYWIVITITDAAGNSHVRYSGGPIRVPGGGLPSNDDLDGNGMADAWEQRHGVTDPDGDPDGDGLTNLEEYRRGTHPRLANRVVLAEGSTTIFRQRLALANPDATRATVAVTFLREDAPPIVREFTVNGLSRLDVPVESIEGLESASFSAVVEAIEGGVVAERTMFWGGWGGHTGKGAPAPRTTWYLAEGDAGVFSTFVLLANPNTAAASVSIDYLFEETGRLPVTRTYVVGAQQRFTVNTRADAELLGRSFSARVTSDVPINVERAMYFRPHPTMFYEAGHVSGAIEEPGTEWFLAEGATLAGFSTYLLLANPNAVPVEAEITYMREGESWIDVRRRLEPLSRTTILLNQQPGLEGVAVSTRVRAPLPIIAERAMYWPGNFATWMEGHASAGLTTTGTVWSLAEGEHGGPRGFLTYLLIANPSSQPASVTVTLLRAAGPPLTLTRTVAANGRRTIAPEDLAAAGLASGERFGALVSSADDVPIVVERAMYWSAAGQAFGGGTNETGVRLR